MCQQKERFERQCVICNRLLIGRSDKRFCDIACKNKYHSEVRKSLKTIQSETMKILTKNVVILSGILGREQNACIVDKLALEKWGFHFNYVSDAENKNGIIHYGVFHFTYRFVHNKRVLITIDKERHPVSPFIFKRWSREIPEAFADL